MALLASLIVSCLVICTTGANRLRGGPVQFQSFPPIRSVQETLQCVLATGEEGVCVSPSHCSSFMRDFRRGLSPQRCVSRSFVFCCPKSGKIVAQNPAQLKEQVSSPSVSFECGRRESAGIFFRKKRSAGLAALPPGLDLDHVPEVVGGVESRKNSWPWMALLGFKTGNGNKFFCSGILINEQWVLTAAHCLKIKDFFVRLGEHDFSTLKDGPTVDLEVVQKVLFPEFKLQEGYDDMALLKLERKIVLGFDIRPVCLPWGRLTDEKFLANPVTITGWGAEMFGGEPSPVLQEVGVYVLDAEKCQSSYSTLSDFSRLWPRGLSSDNIVCAGDLRGNKDSCQGDSGGPIVINNRGEYTLVGIVSKGYGCGNGAFPGIYAPISSRKHLQWIKKIAFA